MARGDPRIAGVSIHASAREATVQTPPFVSRAGFQSTPPRGRRPDARPVPRTPRRVSIHASAREATFGIMGFDGSDAGFNPRLRAGGDRCRGVVALPHSVFQSTPPRGRRQQSVPHHRPYVLFQSTPPRGRRPVVGWHAGAWLRVSIHASAREATVRSRDPVLGGHVSIHASAREATAPYEWGNVNLKFQSTPPRGRRPWPADVGG